MEEEIRYLRVKLVLGLVTLVVGMLAANLALFYWVERTGLHYMLGNSARYICAYGGFAAIILGAMLIHDYCARAFAADQEFVPIREVKEKKRAVDRERKSRRKTSEVASLAILLFMLCSVVVSSRVSYTSTVIITPERKLDLWVNSFDAIRNQWAMTGSSPYLDAQDEPNNYAFVIDEGEGSEHGDQCGDFGFENTTQTGTISSVKLRVYGHCSPMKPVKCHFSVWLWDGSSWNSVMNFQNEASYVWKETNVTAYLDTWAKINGAKIYLQTEDPEGEIKGGHECDAASLQVEYA